MECKFVEGQRVVAIRAVCPSSGDNPIVKGRVYTIRKIGLSWRSQTPVLFFAEIINRPYKTPRGWEEFGYRATHFKPLDEKRLDVFRSLLVPTKEKAIG